MNWIVLYLMLIFPQFSLDANQYGEFYKSLAVDYGATVVADNVDFARACVQGSGPCH